MNSFELISRIGDYLKLQDFNQLTATGLISPTFPNTFNPSSAHDHVRKIVNGTHLSEMNRYNWVLERCIRQVDIPKLGDGSHLCLFEMIAAVIETPARVIPVEEVVIWTLQILEKCFNVPKERLIVSCFGGGEIGGKIFNPDSISRETWLKHGVERVILIPGRSNFVYLENDGEAAGPRCEIYYEIDQGSCGVSFLEIGSVIFETQLFSKGRPVEAKRVASGFAFGVERVLMATNYLPTVYDLENFQPLTQLVIDLMPDKRCLPVIRDKIIITIDVLKALFFVLAEHPVRLSDQQQKLLLRLLHIVRDNLIALNLSIESLLPPLAGSLVQLYQNRLSDLDLHSQELVKVLKELLISPNNKNVRAQLESYVHTS